ncbi:MAG TPA: aspartate 1-decarboxylase [Pseudogracilibacillus sp.]|nr:aspartate 1-decarboxylase [Pseudogracilibacillus sp.]
MFRTMMKSKLHRARVTQADLNYVGSITIDEDLMKEVDILPNEKVQIVNNNNGARFETYVIPGEKGSGVMCVNGAAARLVEEGDIIIVIAYAMVNDSDLSEFRPKIAIMNEDNTIDQFIEEEPPFTVL